MRCLQGLVWNNITLISTLPSHYPAKLSPFFQGPACAGDFLPAEGWLTVYSKLTKVLQSFTSATSESNKVILRCSA